MENTLLWEKDPKCEVSEIKQKISNNFPCSLASKLSVSCLVLEVY